LNNLSAKQISAQIFSKPTYAARIIITLLLVPLLLSAGGCIFLAMLAPHDPATATLIRNDSSAAVAIHLELDSTKYGLQQADTPSEYIEGWLTEFTEGDGVDLVSRDIAKLTGVYSLASGAIMIVHSSLGTKPYFRFKSLQIANGERVHRFDGEDQIAEQFLLADKNENLYELHLTDTYFK
jgi:hypothetical protein